VRDIATRTLRRRAVDPDSALSGGRELGGGRELEVAESCGTRTDTSPGDVCLVTGASGFIGGHLAQRLVQEGRQVRCLVRASSDTSLLEQLDVELAVGDLASSASLVRAAAGCRHVFHCGALVSDWGTTAEIARINVTGTRNILEASIDAGVERFIHVSTTDVYGYPGGTAIDETHPATRFRNWYAQTKLQAEGEVRRAGEASELETVILRPSTVYGPRSTDVVGEIARALRDGKMVLVDGGQAVAGLCYVDNLVDAALLAGSHEAAPGHAFNVSDGLEVTWKQFTDGLASGLGCGEVRWSVPYWLAAGVGFSLEQGYRFLRRTTRVTLPPLLSRQAVHVLGRDQHFSNRKARELLDWNPGVDYETGLEATLAWLRAEHLEPAG
jgi:nucleoside-diphosphate-sugar epimerase